MPKPTTRGILRKNLNIGKINLYRLPPKKCPLSPELPSGVHAGEPELEDAKIALKMLAGLKKEPARGIEPPTY